MHHPGWPHAGSSVIFPPHPLKSPGIPKQQLLLKLGRAAASTSRLVPVLIAVAAALASGCAPARWSPTDPRSQTPDSSQVVIDVPTTIGVGASVTATAH